MLTSHPAYSNAVPQYRSSPWPRQCWFPGRHTGVKRGHTTPSSSILPNGFRQSSPANTYVPDIMEMKIVWTSKIMNIDVHVLHVSYKLGCVSIQHGRSPKHFCRCQIVIMATQYTLQVIYLKKNQKIKRYFSIFTYSTVKLIVFLCNKWIVFCFLRKVTNTLSVEKRERQ